MRRTEHHEPQDRLKNLSENWQDVRELLAILYRNPPEFTSRLLTYAAALEKAMNKKGE